MSKSNAKASTSRVGWAAIRIFPPDHSLQRPQFQTKTKTKTNTFPDALLHIIHHLILIDPVDMCPLIVVRNKESPFFDLMKTSLANHKLWCNWVHKTVQTKWRVQFSDFSNFPRIRRSAALSRRALQSIKRSMNWIVFCQQAYNELLTEKIQTKITSILVKQSQHC